MSYRTNESNLADIIFKGAFDNIRTALKRRMMENMEKEVDVAIDDMLQGIKLYTDYHFDHITGDPIINISFRDKKVSSADPNAIRLTEDTNS